jgi:hypothetical protein
MTDVSYFLGASLRLEDRRACEEMLVREYFEQLHAHGVRGVSWEECWLGYRRQCFLGLLMTWDGWSSSIVRSAAMRCS